MDCKNPTTMHDLGQWNSIIFRSEMGLKITIQIDDGSESPLNDQCKDTSNTKKLKKTPPVLKKKISMAHKAKISATQTARFKWLREREKKLLHLEKIYLLDKRRKCRSFHGK